MDPFSSPDVNTKSIPFDIEYRNISQANILLANPSYYFPIQFVVPVYMPVQVILREIQHPKYKMVGQINLNVDRLDDLFIASDLVLNIYGLGPTKEDAVNEFTSMLVDLFEELIESECNLSSHLHRQLDYLRTFIDTL